MFILLALRTLYSPNILFYCFDHPRYVIKINVQQLVYTTNVWRFAKYLSL